MRPILADQTGSGGIAGSGTAGKLAKWNGAASLTDSAIFSESGGPLRGKASSLDISGSLDVTGAAHFAGNHDIDGNSNVDGRCDIANGLLVSAPASPNQAGTVVIGAQDNALEGGEVVLKGGGNAGVPFADWNWDSWTGMLRWFTGGIIKMSLTTAGLLSVAAAISCGTTFNLNGVVALSFLGTAMRVGVDATWATLEFYTGGVLRFILNATDLSPNLDATYSIGTAAKRIKNLFISGAIVGGDEVKTADVDQGTFVNVQTAINNLSFPIGINEKWVCDFVIPVVMGVAATGVKFYFTFPVGCTGEITYEGNVATAQTWQDLYQAVLTVPGTFFVTGIITGAVRLRAVIRNAGTAGTIQLVGITGGATTTCAVKKGASMLARRAA